MNIWHKLGYIGKKLDTHIDIRTYYTDNDGNCYGRYNVTLNRHGKINFDYLREYTPQNERELVAECIRLYFKSNGLKIDKGVQQCSQQ